MSRIGRKPIAVPDKVKVSSKDGAVSIAGPLGTLSVKHKPEIKIDIADPKAVKVTIDEEKYADDRAGTVAASL